MDFSGEFRIPAPREVVWEALNDPEVLRQCITGCESLEKNGEKLDAVVNAKVGPVKAKFNGTVELTDLNPPESYRLVGEGKAGAAGFAKGDAKVDLAQEGDETVLTYAAEAKVGGKLAQVGARLIKGAADKYASEFFAEFCVLAAARAGVQTTKEDYIPAAPPKKSWSNPLTVSLVVIAAILLLYFLLS